MKDRASFFSEIEKLQMLFKKMNHVRFSRLHLPSVVLSVFSASVGFALSSRIKKVKKK